MVIYRKTTDADIKQIAQIHKEQFSTHYLGQFSLSLLEKFYKNLLDGGIIFLVSEEDGKILGFVLGGEWKKISEQLSLFMKRNIIRSLFESLVRPKTWSKSIQKFMSIFIKTESDSNNLDNKEKYTLLSISISKGAQGKGIGSGLVDSFNREMAKNSDRYYLSVQDTNEIAIRFYKKKGFVEAYAFPGEIQMIKELNNA